MNENKKRVITLCTPDDSQRTRMDTAGVLHADPESTPAYMRASLDEEGFMIIPHFVPTTKLSRVTDDLVHVVSQRGAAHPVFGAESRSRGADHRRISVNCLHLLALRNQQQLPELNNVLSDCSAAFAECGIATGAVNERRCDHWRLIGTVNDNLVKQQIPHIDYASAGVDPQEQRPLAALIAVHGSNTIDLWPYSHRAPRCAEALHMRLRIPVGWCVVLDAALIHAGSPYAHPALRLHCDLMTEACSQRLEGHRHIQVVDDEAPRPLATGDVDCLLARLAARTDAARRTHKRLPCKATKVTDGTALSGHRRNPGRSARGLTLPAGTVNPAY